MKEIAIKGVVMLQLCVLAHACNPNTQEAEARGCKYKDSLGYRVPGQEDTILKANRADKIAQQVKVPVSKSDDLMT